MTKICHAHCPDESGMFLAVLAAVLAVIIGQVVESLFWAIIAVASVLGAAGIAHLAYVLHRDRPGRLAPASAEPARALPPARRSAALPAPVIRALPAGPDEAVPLVLRGHVERDAAGRRGIPRADGQALRAWVQDSGT